jgi:YfiH family protein
LPGGPGAVTVEYAFTDASWDFAEGAERDPARLRTDLSRLSDEVGVPVLRMHQVHGNDVAVVDDDTTDVPRADALVTTSRGVALMTRAADCVPVLLADPAQGVVAAVHSGRQGVVAGVVPAAVARMRQLGAERIEAWIGPHVCGACYEVPDDMRTEVAGVEPAAHAQTSWGTPSVDLGAAVLAQLDRDGVSAERIGGCTMEDPSLWSHRRDGARAGRLAGVIWMAA